MQRAPGLRRGLHAAAVAARSASRGGGQIRRRPEAPGSVESRPLREVGLRVTRRLAPLILALASIALTLAVFEIGLRVVLGRSAEPSAPETNRLARLYRPSENPEIVFEHVPGAQVAFPSVVVGDRATAPWEVRIDEKGLRYNGRPEPFEAEIRGVCLGDSTMFGVGLNDHETIPAQLSVIVSERLGRRFECLNMGVSNYTTVQEVAYFRQRGLDYDPSIVVIGIYTNDFKTSLGSIAVLDGELQLVSPGTPSSLAAWSRQLELTRRVTGGVLAFRDLLRARGLYPLANAKPLKPAQISAVYGALDELRSLLEPRDIPLVLLLFPRDWQLGAPDREAATERQRASRAYCREHGIPCIDLLDHYYGRPVESYFRAGDDSHPHAEAARVSAEMAADVVLEILAPGAQRSTQTSGDPSAVAGPRASKGEGVEEGGGPR